MKLCLDKIFLILSLLCYKQKIDYIKFSELMFFKRLLMYKNTLKIEKLIQIYHVIFNFDYLMFNQFLNHFSEPNFYFY